MELDDLARFGRLHPLVLHFPIGLLLGALVLEALATRGKVARGALALYLWLAAGSAVLAASSGWILAHEDGYGGETLERHERLGIALAIAAVVAALLHDPRGRVGVRLGLYRSALVVACVLLVPAGHLGSTLTHGTDWLDGPRERPARKVEPPALDAGVAAQPVEGTRGADAAPEPVEDAAPDTYATEIAPLLATYCTSCHGAQKRKGGLRLDSPEALLAGGDSGPVLVPGDPAASLFLARARLPLEHEDHMPPEGKPQPSAEDLALLEAWVAAGAPFGSPSRGAADEEQAGTSAPSEPVRGAAAEPAPPPSVPAPPAEALAALAAAFVHAEPLEPGRPELRVDVAAVARTFGDAEVAALLVPLAPFVAELSLARSAIRDAALRTLVVCTALRRLDLRATAVTSAGLGALARLPALEELNLAQTRLDEGAVEVLLALPGLRRLNLWEAGLAPEALARLRARAGLELVTGDEPLAEVLASEGELAFTSERPLPGAESVPVELRPVNATCPVSGSPVNPKYALVHSGAAGTRVVGFCCPNCPKEFWADPARFEAKLP
ncbi:MAG TPA: c-type cytochrome domain-containing protein [Planctomycetota bacterium]